MQSFEIHLSHQIKTIFTGLIWRVGCPIILFLAHIDLYGQLESKITTPDSFQEFRLGSRLAKFIEKYPLVTKEKLSAFSSEIKTDSMDVYILKNQITKSRDKISITLCFYKEYLSVIQVEYKNRQSSKVLIGALKEKYGLESRYADNVLNNTRNGRSQIVENLYWENSQCYILAFTYNDDNGLAFLTYADEEVQNHLRSLELKESQKKID